MALRPHLAEELVAIERLELVVPVLVDDPLELRPGAARADQVPIERWQSRRSHLGRVRLSLDATRLERFLESRRMAERGFLHLTLRIAEDVVVVGFEVREWKREVPLTVRLRLQSVGMRELMVLVDEIRCYGYLSTPAPLVVQSLIEAAIGRAAGDARLGVDLSGVAAVRMDPLRGVLFAVLPHAGWRLPKDTDVYLASVRVGEERIDLDFDWTEGARRPTPPLGFPAGDELLAHKEIEAALLAYRAASTMTGGSPELQTRILALLVASPETWEEAARLAQGLLENDDRRARIAAQLTLAQLAAENGEVEEAAARYVQLAEEAALAGEIEDAEAADLRAAELYLAEGQLASVAAATQGLERVLGRRMNPRAATLLAQRYTEEGRWDDLAQLERRWVTVALDAAQEAQARHRLGRLYLHRLGDAARARAELERAVRLNPVDAGLWLLLAEARRAIGDRTNAIAALDRALELGDDLQRAEAEELKPAIWAELPLDEETGHAEMESDSGEHVGEDDQVAASYEAVLAIRPDDIKALEALGDLSYRRRDFMRARELYARLMALPATGQSASLWKRRGELAEAMGDEEEAEALYRRAVEIDPGFIPGYEALAQLGSQRGDLATVYDARKAILDTLPLDAVELITELRQQLGDLARSLGHIGTARSFYELVLAQHPDAVAALGPLAEIYAAQGEWEHCAECLSRLAYLGTSPRQRATMLYRQAEVYRLYLAQPDRANSAYLKAADIDPTHQPTLRRLVVYYFSIFDIKSMREVVEELEAAKTPLEEANAAAGMGFALAGEELLAARYLSACDAVSLATALGALQVREPAALDRPLEIAVDALTRPRRSREADVEDDGTPEEQLMRALDQRLQAEPGDLGARLVRARLAEMQGDLVRARQHYAVLAYVDHTSDAARHLAGLPQAQLSIAEPPRRSDWLRTAMATLGPQILGVVVPQVREGEPLPALASALAPLAAAFDLRGVTFAAVDELGEPAWCELSAPPRVLVRRDLVADTAALGFAVARMLYLLRAGIPLIQGRSTDDVAALLRAAAALLGGTPPPAAPYVGHWYEALRGLELDRRSLPQDRRASARLLGDTAGIEDLADRIDSFLATERLIADRTALLITGDFGAALRALTPPWCAEPSARARALGQSPELRALVELVTG